MKSNYFLGTIWLFVLPATLGAQGMAHHTFAPPSDVLSLNWVLDEVLTNNPSLKGARAHWGALRERVIQERAWDDPRAGVDLKAARFVNVPADSFTDQSLFAEQTIPIAGKNKLRGHAAAAEASASGEEYRQHDEQWNAAKATHRGSALLAA